MLGSSIIAGIYNRIKNHIKFCGRLVFNLPYWIKAQISLFKNYIIDLRYKLDHLKETNLELGIEHLYKRNLNDAIIRFILVNKFFSKGDSKANYWLGWTYFLKNNYVKSLYYLKLDKESDPIGLGSFIQNYTNYNEIPSAIWYQYRELISEYYIDNFYLEDMKNLYEVFAQKTLNQITKLPDHYSILELGSNIGILGRYVRKRFPDTFTMKAVEVSDSMTKLASIYYPGLKIYDELLNLHIQEFLKLATQNSDKFDVILSCYSLTFTKELDTYFNDIYSLLNDNGFFAFCLPTNNMTKLSLDRKEFVFDQTYIKKAVNASNLILLSTDELSLGINNKYSIFTCKKVIGK